MPIILYTTRGPSPPARAVEMVIRILKLDVENREVDLSKKENLEPWFVKLNPTHQIPVLDDEGYILADSHAIIEYLFTVYAPKDILEQYFPSDPKLRGIITSRWHFESGILFARIKTILLPIYLWDEKNTPLEKSRWVIEAVEFLEKILEEREWLAADRLTVADISTITTIDLIELLVPLKHYKNVSTWAKRVRNTSPFYNDVGIEGLVEFTSYFKENIAYDAENYWNQIQSGQKK